MTATLQPATTSPINRRAQSRVVKDKVATVLVTASFLVALIPLVWLLWTVVSKGLHVITAADWWTNDERFTQDWRTVGGGTVHALAGTAEQVLLCSVISVPVAVLAAVYLVEYGRGWFRGLVTFMVDILTGVPSIVAALFIYAVFL